MARVQIPSPASYDQQLLSLDPQGLNTPQLSKPVPAPTQLQGIDGIPEVVSTAPRDTGGIPEMDAGMQPGIPTVAAADPQMPRGDELTGRNFDQFVNDPNEMSPEEQAGAVAKMEQDLEGGGSSIEDAFRQASEKMEINPDDLKLTKKEKGLMVMEFGLALMAASSGDAYGGDIGGAIGSAGLSTLDRYYGIKRSKEDLARQEKKDTIAMAEASRKFELDTRRVEATERNADASEKRANLQERQLDEAGWVISENKDGNAIWSKPGQKSKPALDEAGNSMTMDAFKKSKGGAEGGVWQSKRDGYMEIYGRDDKGNPLKGAAKRRAEEEALEYANGTRKSAEADDMMKYRDGQQALLEDGRQKFPNGEKKDDGSPVMKEFDSLPIDKQNEILDEQVRKRYGKTGNKATDAAAQAEKDALQDTVNKPDAPEPIQLSQQQQDEAVGLLRKPENKNMGWKDEATGITYVYRNGSLQVKD